MIKFCGARDAMITAFADHERIYQILVSLSDQNLDMVGSFPVCVC